MPEIYYTLRSQRIIEQLVHANTEIDGWFFLASDDMVDIPGSGVFTPTFVYANKDEALIKSHFITEMYNGTLKLLGFDGTINLDLLIRDNVRYDSFSSFEHRLKFLKGKVFNEEYNEEIFQNHLNSGRTDLALVYLSNFDNYCRYFLYVIARSKIDYVSLYKILESLRDRISYYIKVFKTEDITKKMLEVKVNKLVYGEESEPAFINTFTKFANHYIIVGEISRHGMKLNSNAGALSEDEKKLSESEVLEIANKIILKSVINSLVNLKFLTNDNLAKIQKYDEADFVLCDEIRKPYDDLF